MKTNDLPDDLVAAVNTLLKLHQLQGADARMSAVGFVSDGKTKQWLLNGSYPIELSEVLRRLEEAGANVKPLRERVQKAEYAVKRSAENRTKLRASAAAKLTKEEREAVGL